MAQEDAALQLHVAEERFARDRRELARIRPERHGGETPSLRRRAGMAVISLGEKLAGERPAAPTARRPRTRRFATRPS